MLPNDRLKALDGWRAVSVGLVIIDHLMTFSNVRVHAHEAWFSALGTTGVSIFFVISGFVICRGLIREAENYGSISLTGFYLRRFFRIVPPLGLYIAVIGTLSTFGIVAPQSRDVFRALTFTCNFPGANCGGYLGGHTWSLSVEEQFYLVIPILFLTMSENRGRATILLICIPAMGLLIAPNFVGNFLLIAAGVACALNERWMREICSRIPQSAIYLAFPILIVAMRLCYTRFTAIGYACAACMIAGMLVASIGRTNRMTVLLSSNWLGAIGRASYGMYLWQQLATYAFPDVNAWFYVLSVSGCVAFSMISYRYFESRCIAFGRSLSADLIRAPRTH